MTLMHPSAIWLYLAQFFTQDVLVSLMRADCTIRSLDDRVAASLEDQYRDLDFRFLHLGDGTARRLRKRVVANRVRVLRIGPYFVRDVLDSSQDLPFEEAVEPVRGLLARFRNVEEYHVLWHERPTMSTVPPVDPPKNDHFDTLRPAAALLSIPFSSTSYLRTLTVELSLDKAEHLFLPTFLLPNLEEFNLCIRDDHTGNLDAAGYIMVHHLARFLNNTHRTLRSLSFKTSLRTDFSPFFSALGFFAHLSKLALSIPTSDPHLGDSSALKGFLHAQLDTLEHFTLRGFCSRSRVRTDVLSHWLTECLSGLTFSSLHTLNVGTSFIPVDVVMLCVQSTETLTVLDIAGEYLSFEAVQEILRTKPVRQLSSFTVGVTCLCPELIDMLAEHLPHLTKLNLRMRAVTAHRSERPMFIAGSRKQQQSQVERFGAEMGTRVYKGWKLRELGVWKFNSKLQYQGWCVNILRDSLGPV
ncbi:hypothetical protein FB451DRAFT_1270192 [Mycena latifolia]|nr:hypothetical protein FB451DRAFT_1270192 [Mycena latifolia]